MSRVSRRRWLQLSAAAGVAAFGSAACSTSQGARDGAGALVIAPPPEGVLGANFNGDPRAMTFRELRTAEASWVRGFFAMTGTNKHAPASAPAISTLLRAAERGFGTVLSLKFPYFPQLNKPLPRPGTDAMKTELARLDAVLPVVLDAVDILVIGNEPFFECPREDWNNGALNDFYETVAGHVIEYRAAHFPDGCKTELYMGSLNRLDDPEWTGAGTDRWMAYVRDTPEIRGTDIHPHVVNLEETDAYLDYVVPRLGPDKKFLATEFSLVRLWGEHLRDRVPGEYAAEHGVSRDTKVWQVIRDALDEPFPQQRWYDFLRTSRWFEDNKNFPRDQVKRFRDTGRLAVATYGIGQDAAMSDDFGPGTTPWLLNSVFASRTVRTRPDGSPAPNYAWLDSFKAAQRQ